ncbi:MAG: hypothetical protein AAFV53_31460 [Myxococcota bacterium]
METDRSGELWATAFLMVAVAAMMRSVLPGGGAGFLQRDALFSAVVLQHLGDAWLLRSSWFEAPLGWPLPDRIALNDWTAGPALLSLPLRWAGLDGVQIYGAVSALGMLLTAWAGHRVARALLGPGVHTWLAGVACGLAPLQLGHAHHVNLVYHAPMLLGGLALGGGLLHDRPRTAALGGALIGLSFHFGVYMGIHSLAVGLCVVVAVGLSHALRRTSAMAGMLGAAMGGATFAPVAWVYVQALTRWRFEVSPDALQLPGGLVGRLIQPDGRLPLHAMLGVSHPGLGIEPPNPGYVIVLFAAAGLYMRPDRASAAARCGWRAIGLCALLGAALALRPTLEAVSLQWDQTWLPGVWAWIPQTGRGAGRWMLLPQMAAGLLAAAGAAKLGRQRGGTAMVLAGLGLTMAERLPIAAQPLSEHVPTSVYARLADPDLPDGPIHDVLRNRAQCQGEQRLRAALTHRRPLVGGLYARAFDQLKGINHITGRWPQPNAALFLRASGVSVVLEHPPLRGPPPPGWTCAIVDDHRLCADTAPWTPLPAPEDVAAHGQGPAVGIQFISPPPPDRPVVVQCDQVAVRAPERPWRLLSTIRGRSDFEVYFAQPCATVRADGWTTRPLYASPDASDWP